MVKYRWKQVVDMGYQNNAGTTELYEVPALYNLRMYSCWLSCRLSADAGVEGSLSVRTDEDGVHQFLLYLRMDKAGQIAIALPLYPGVMIPPGYDIAIVSSTDNLDCRGGFFGELIPV